MTSAVVLQLAQEGKLGLQDPVSKYVSGVPGGENITVAELLKMRSGLYNYTNSPVMATSIDDDPTKAWTPQELLDIAFAQPANFAPDAEFEYSNTNYALLGLVIEKVDGKPLATAFHDRLFEPFGMLNTELPVGTSNSIPACRSPTADSFAGCCARFRAVCGFNEHLERARVAQGRPRGGPEGRFHLGDQSGTGGSHWPARARFLTGLIKNDMSLPNWWERGPARPALGLW